ncbi:MAG: oligosaccharide flippase family protein [Anaerolineae bacterium]
MLNPLRILRSSSKITLVTLISAPITFALNIFIARNLSPDQLGQINFVMLWLMYANLITPGTFAGGQREMIYRLGRDETEPARQAQNVAVSGELVWSLLPFSFFLIVASLFTEPTKKWGFIIISVTYLVATANKLLSNLHIAHQRFELYTRFTLVRVILSPLLIFLTLNQVGSLMILTAPALSEMVLLGLYLFKAPRLGLAPNFSWPRLREFTQAGLPIGLNGLVYWAYRLIGQTFVAIWFPAQALAFYIFSANIVTLLSRAFGDFSGVLTPALWKELGQSETPQQLYRETARISIFVMVATCATTNLAQASFGPLVALVLPKYIESIPIFEVLAFNIIVLTMTFIPSLVLDSAVVNKQWPHFNVWLLGLIINCGANYLTIQLGGNLLTIAWNDIWVQLVVVVTLYKIAQRYLFPDKWTALRVYLVLGLLGSMATLVFIVLKLPFFVSLPPVTLISTVTNAGIRIMFVFLSWCIVGVIMWISFLSKTSHPSGFVTPLHGKQ